MGNLFAQSVGENGAGNIILEGKHLDGRLADGEGWHGDHRRQQALEALATSRQLRRIPRGRRMDVGADVMRNEADDTFAIGRPSFWNARTQRLISRNCPFRSGC